MKITAKANANIALTKYWGKRDKELMLPQNGSTSMTLSGLYTITTVEFDDKYEKDIFILGKKEMPEDCSQINKQATFDNPKVFFFNWFYSFNSKHD